MIWTYLDILSRSDTVFPYYSPSQGWHAASTVTGVAFILDRPTSLFNIFNLYWFKIKNLFFIIQGETYNSENKKTYL